MTKQERDERLNNIDQGYHQRMDDYEQKMDDIKERAQEKQDRGEDISADVEEYKSVKAQQDKEVDEWKENRQKVYDEYEKDHEAEQEQDREQEYDEEEEM